MTKNTAEPAIPFGTMEVVPSETIVTYRDGDQTYEIDHLGIGHPETQWGQFAVYWQGQQVGVFAVAEDGNPIPVEFAVMRGTPPDVPAELPVSNDELIRFAKMAVAE